jgi:hypothetical protein
MPGTVMGVGGGGSMYNAQLRRVHVQLYTRVGWVTGTLRIPAKSRLIEHLNHSREFLSLTDVRFEMQPDPIPFFAVQRDAIILMVPPDNEPINAPTLEEMVVHPLSCMLELGTLYGEFKTLRSVRVSDFISATKGFFHLESCDLVLGDRFGRQITESHRAHVLVHIKHVIGVTEDSVDEDSA